VGLITLCQAAGVNPQAVDAGSIGFILGPRLNASGRLERAMISYNLLVATDADEARQLAHELNELNQKRQEETRTVVEKSIQLVDASGGPGLVVFAISSEFNEGIVGLAAARVMEKYYRPAVVGTDQGETIRCSCRSIPELDITAVLDECANLLLHHGGHAAAAGFTVLARDFPALRQRIEAIAARKLAGLDLVPTLSAEMVVKLTDLGPALFRALQDLQPTGYGNRAPAFIVRGLRSRSTRTVGQDKRHLKLWLTDGFLPINAIAFGFGFMEAEFLPDTRADFLFTYEKNEYNGTVDFQMVVKDIQIQSP
jgi:single-stranded-DNA-specific exonuclease